MRMNDEARFYLAEGLHHRARYYGADMPDRGEDAELVLAVAWFRAWWKDLADRREARDGRAHTGQLVLPIDDQEEST